MTQQIYTVIAYICIGKVALFAVLYEMYSALSVCGFLCVFPMLLTYLLWSHFMPGTWLLAVTAFCVEAVIKEGAIRLTPPPH